MADKIEIYKIDYDLITRAKNLEVKDKAMLFGSISLYIAAKVTENGLLNVFMETIGCRNTCAKKINDINYSNIQAL